MTDVAIPTERMVLRDWRADDVDDFLRVCSDPQVMEMLGPVMDREGVARLIADLQDRAARYGHTLWAMERKSDRRVIGFTGAIRGTAPEIEGEREIGWRVASDCWRQGYAYEAAAATLAWIAANRPGEHAVAITAVINQRSRALMEKLGMSYQPRRDFDHPRVPPGSPLVRHVVYRKDPPL